MYNKIEEFLQISIVSFSCPESFLFELKSIALTNSGTLNSRVIFILLFLTRINFFR